MPHKIRVRSLLLGAAFTLLFILLIGRLYWLQVVESPWLTARAQAMWDKEESLPADRGTIYDRNLEVLAGDATGYTVVLNPKLIGELGLAREVAQGLSQVLGVSEAALYEHATNRDADGNLRIYRQIGNDGRKLPTEKAEAIRAWKDAFVKEHRIKGDDWPGVILEEEQMRYYPKGSLAAHVLGFVNKNGDAASGLELAMDELLRGVPGSVAYQKDQKGRRLPDSKPELVPPVDGQSLVLTIDQTIQHYTETALKKAYEQYKPKSMTAIAVDPRTMEVLSLANFPTFDPNEYWKYDPEKDFKNMAIQSRYEPGSTFKLVTLAAAVEQGVFKPEETYKSGSIRVADRTLNDHRRGGWGEISYLEGLLRSSNVAFVKLGYEMLGENLLREYIDRFGFTRKTGIDLPGEVDPMIRFRYASEIATTTYGQGGAIVTPIQQLAAYAAIANGGKLMQPYVVKRVVDSDTGEVLMQNGPKELGQVVSPAVAKQVTEYLKQVVSDERGTGRRARVDGYEVAGKTGTANIVVDGEYSPDTWVVSFIGYAPADDPRIAVAIIADQPDLGGDSNRAGEVSGTVFREIVSQSLRHMGVKPDTAPIAAAASIGGDTLAPVPDLQGLAPRAAAKELDARDFEARLVGDGAKVVGQYPAAGERMPPSAQVYLLTVPQEEAPVPDMTGAGLRDVVQLCALLGLRCEAEGEGYVVEQDVVDRDGEAALRVRLEPLRPRPSGEAAEAEEGGEGGTNGEAGEEADGGDGEEAGEEASEAEDGAAGGVPESDVGSDEGGSAA
ncbi:penicillin-binding transpeptidase domain-containing protein [Paenibacillus sp.]|uniref:penicillin-binding transpeptidase domain-containing protein n=1 Tax=Paenibacillus sp. TaxID=58172 RepID=UPI002D755E1D|nr:penicillin-binding transpeptidase domain-containing protein [Paenibacillus sp.]HZG57852.1 penicillin-binding transpeptidase domain-containing protein [Paenibacillus sp.]